MEINILLCKCGSETPASSDASDGTFIVCYDCWQSTKPFPTEELAIRDWNTINKKRKINEGFI